LVLAFFKGAKPPPDELVAPGIRLLIQADLGVDLPEKLLRPAGVARKAHQLAWRAAPV
jgi:hypothetical protein